MTSYPPKSLHSIDLGSTNTYDLNYLAPHLKQTPGRTTTTGPGTFTATDSDALRGGTPSPTPSEAKEMKNGAIDWKAISHWRFWIRREWLWYYVALVLIIVISVLMTLYHKQIVEWLTPVTKFLHDLSFGWLVPIAVLFVISFPPLFGHEIVAVLCGLVWGLWIGFAIVAAGTFLGEVGNFYAFKYCCRSRGEKLERSNISYACLAKVVRDGGFKIALVARLSAIPGHFTTAVFSTCGMGIFVFSLAAILSLPKQFITVYLGVILEQSATGETDSKSKIISRVVIGVTILITVVAMWYMLRQMNKVKPDIIYAKRKARQAKLERGSSPSLSAIEGHLQNPSSISLNTTNYGGEDINDSEAELPLTSRMQPMGYGGNYAASTATLSTYPPSQSQSQYQSQYNGNGGTQTMHAPIPRRAGEGNPISQLEQPEPIPDSAVPFRQEFGYHSVEELDTPKANTHFCMNVQSTSTNPFRRDQITHNPYLGNVQTPTLEGRTVTASPTRSNTSNQSKAPTSSYPNFSRPNTKISPPPLPSQLAAHTQEESHDSYYTAYSPSPEPGHPQRPHYY